MPIRNGKLWRLCLKCNVSFCPTGRCSKICNNCSNNKNSWLDKIVREQNNKRRIK